MDNFFQTVNNIVSSGWWLVALYVFIFCIVVLWLALIYWTFKDARKRVDDPIVIIVACLVAFVLPYIGALIYAILRPAEYLSDVKERELEMQAIQQELTSTCPACGQFVRSDFLYCPSCCRQLRTPCPSCGRVLDPGWKMCPYCAQDAKPRRGSVPVDQPTQLVETT